MKKQQPNNINDNLTIKVERKIAPKQYEAEALKRGVLWTALAQTVDIIKTRQKD